MNLPAGKAPGPEVVTQESLLLGVAERIGRIPDGRSAVHLHLSRLRPQNRQDGHMRIALRMLEPMVNAYRGQMFMLGNSDVVFIVKDAYPADLEEMIFKLRGLFGKDPLSYADTGEGGNDFCTYYDLSEDYDAFLAMVQAAVQQARQRLRDQAKAPAPPKPMDARALHRLLESLSDSDFAPLIRRQSAIAIADHDQGGGQSGAPTGPSRANVLFQEFFVSLSELQKALCPAVELLGNRWLFQHLSQTLDQRVLDVLHGMRLAVRPNAFSLNLNLSTVLSPAFDAFAEGEAEGVGIWVELQVLDVLADSRSYYAARDRLRERGHKVVIDGLNELTVRFMDVGQFDADLYKLFWSPDLREADNGSALLTALGGLDPEKLLLARCDSEAAITWGLDQGISRFQGRYVDAMLAAFTMHTNEKAREWTLQDCIARRAVISGPLRDQCPDPAILDRAPVILVPKRPRRRETA